MLGALALGLGGLFGGLGGLFGGNASSRARRRLIEAANLPGLDIGALTGESLSNILANLPQAENVAARINAANAQQLLENLGVAIPGYSGTRETAMKRINEYLSGVLPEDVSQAVMRATAGRAIGTGLGGGTPLARALTWRDLGRTSEQAIRYGLESFLRTPSALPYTTPMQVGTLVGPSPLDLINLRAQERAQKQKLLAEAAGLKGATGTWANIFGQLGGLGIGAGLRSILGLD